MISGTYILSGTLLLVTGYLFDQHQLTAASLTVCWSVVFFFASAVVSAAYLTVSEIFPIETRALVIALFYASVQESARSSDRSSTDGWFRPARPLMCSWRWRSAPA